jgi:hypothetical protein
MARRVRQVADLVDFRSKEAVANGIGTLLGGRIAVGRAAVRTSGMVVSKGQVTE